MSTAALRPSSEQAAGVAHVPPPEERRLWRRALGLIVGLIVRLWVRTLRVRLVIAASLDLDAAQPVVLAFWHGQQMLLLPLQHRWPRSRGVMVSHSRDGELQTGAMRALGFAVVRGSSSRGGMQGLRKLVRMLRGGHDAVFAVDGPRGPLREPKPGASVAASLGGALLVPVGAHAPGARVVRGTWDRFEIPLPFARVTVVLGAPVNEPDTLGPAIDAAGRKARESSDAGAAA